MEKLSAEEVSEAIEKFEGWEFHDGKWLVKKYRFASFMDGVGFVNRIANRSEEVNHHPFISIDYRVVTIKLTSWNARGVTPLDVQLIQEYDAYFFESIK